MRSDKALSSTALEVTQRIQLHFPGNISPDVLHFWNSCPLPILRAHLATTFGSPPKEVIQQLVPKEELGIISTKAKTHFPGARRFVTAAHFREDLDSGPALRLSDDFKELLLRKIEEFVPKSILGYHLHAKNVSELDVVRFFGGKEAITTTLAELFYLLKQQPQGQHRGMLSLDSINNFHVEDSAGNLLLLAVQWFENAWDIDAYDPKDGIFSTSIVGRRLFSRVQN